MLVILGIIAYAVVAAAAGGVEHEGRPVHVPQVGISKGARSQSPDIIYLSGGHDDRHDVPLGPHGQLDQNNVIASVYGPAFLRPEWIWNGDHYFGQDRDHRQHGNYGVHQYAIYDPYGRGERNRELYGRGEVDNYQYGRGRGGHDLQPYNDKNIRDHERLLNMKRVQEHEQLHELNRLREQAKLMEIKRLRETAQLKEMLREKDREIHRQRQQRPSTELQREVERQRRIERHRELERQREQIHARHGLPMVENVGDKLHPGYEYPAVGERGRYADAGYGGRNAVAGYGERNAIAGYGGRNAEAGYGGRKMEAGYDGRNEDDGYGGRYADPIY